MRLVFTLLVALAAPTPILARCGDNPTDAAKIAATRATIANSCDCSDATPHGHYVRCAASIARADIVAGRLPRDCKGAVVRCAAHSTCGKRGFVTCCRTHAAGIVSCELKRKSALCVAPPGETACVGTVPSCCDACSGQGCATTSTTTTATATTTTTSGTCPAVCGNGVCEAGETLATCPADCEPSGVVTLPIAIAASVLGPCSASTRFFFAGAFEGCYSGMDRPATSTDMVTVLPGRCGGSPPTITGGASISLVNGQSSVVLNAINDCVNAGVRDYVVPVIAPGANCDGSMPVGYFTTLHIESVIVSGLGKGIEFTQSCPECGEGVCSDGDTCSTCAADCGGCPAMCP